MYLPPAPSSPPCRKSSSMHNQLLLLNAASEQHSALAWLSFSHKEAREILCAADCTRKAWFTALLEGHVIGYANHLRSYTLNLYRVPECIQVVLFSLRKNCFVSCLLCPLLEAGFVTPLLCGSVAVRLSLKTDMHSHGH